MEKKTYRQYLEAIEDGSAALTGEPAYYARRHGKLYLWPMPDAVHTVNIDYARYHPDTWTDVSFGVQFNEAIYEGVLAALYRGQLFEKLRLNNKKINSDGTDESATETFTDGQVTETTEAELDSDKSAEVLSYEFDKDFPEITKHAAAYEAEIEKLIENMNMDIETVLVEYRDI